MYKQAQDYYENIQNYINSIVVVDIKKIKCHYIKELNLYVI